MARKKRIPKFNIFFCFGMLILIFIFAFAMYVQASEYFEMKEQMEQSYKEQARAVEKNQEALNEIIYHDSDAYVEKVAREKLGLVKPNEIVFV